MLRNRRETCKACWRVSAVGFDVPDELWHAVVPGPLRESVLCVGCFTHFADEHLADWAGQIRFFPVSLYEGLFCGASMEQCGGLISEAELRKRNEMPFPAPESYVKHVDAAETDLEDRHNSAPEIRVGQVWRRRKDGYMARVKEIEGTTVWLVDVAICRGGGVWLRLSQFPDEGSRPFTDDYVRTYFDVVYDPPDRSNPSLDLEGLAKLDAEIADLRKDPMAWRGEPDWAARQVRIDALSMARNWLVSTPSEEQGE